MATGILYQGNTVVTVTYTPETDAKVRVSCIGNTGVSPVTLISMNGQALLSSDFYSTNGGIRNTVAVEFWVAAGVTVSFATTVYSTLISCLES